MSPIRDRCSRCGGRLNVPESQADRSGFRPGMKPCSRNSGGRLDAPLTELERGEFRQLQEKLQQEAEVLVGELGEVSVQSGLGTDPFGRRLLDYEDAGKRLSAREEALLKTRP